MSDDLQTPIASASPVEALSGDRTDDHLEDGIALCLSGGGYRAMLFHVGALLRLNEFGVIGKIARFSSVSGGSITAGVLALNWKQLSFDASGHITNLDEVFVQPLRRLASKTIDVPAVFGGVFSSASISDKVADEYRRVLFVCHFVTDACT